MDERPSVEDLPVKALVALIGADHVSPGAGSAGAVALALAAACAGKAVSVSLKHRPGELPLQEARERFAEMARRALSGADRDSEAFEALVHERSAAAAARLLDSGEQLAQLAGMLAAAIDDIEPRIEPSVAGDLAAARALAGAAGSIQARNAAEARDKQRRIAGT